MSDEKQDTINNTTVEKFPIIVPTSPEPISEEALRNISMLFSGLGEIYAKMKRSHVVMID